MVGKWKIILSINMKRNVFTTMAAALLVVGLGACGGNGNKPFKEYVDCSYESALEIRENPEILNDSNKVKSMNEKWERLLKELNEKTIEVEIEDSLGFELLSDRGKIYDVYNRGGQFTFTIDVDAKKTGPVPGTYMGVLFDDKGNELYAQTIDDKNKNGNVKFDYYVSVNKLGLFFFGEATKLVIMKMNAERRNHIMKINNERVRKIIARLNGEVVVDEDEADESNDASVIFSYGKLGPVEVGKAMPSLPASVEGLYDNFGHKKEEHEDDMDGAWTEEYYLFTKDGKEVFRANIYEGKVNSIRLLSGSSFIKTPDGISVGSSARVLFNKVPMEWGTYYEGETFGTNGHFTYYVSSDDLIQTDIPHKADHFKPDAKVVGIVYQ